MFKVYQNEINSYEYQSAFDSHFDWQRAKHNGIVTTILIQKVQKLNIIVQKMVHHFWAGWLAIGCAAIT